MASVLRVDGREFDPEDLTYAEKAKVRRMIRTLLADECEVPRCVSCGSHDIIDVFEWRTVGDEETIPATITVFMQRDDPAYTLEQAMQLKARDVLTDNDGAPGAVDPPTPAAAGDGDKTPS